MKRNILAMTIAATLVAPMATYADVKLSGTVQGEYDYADIVKGTVGDDAGTFPALPPLRGAVGNGLSNPAPSTSANVPAVNPPSGAVPYETAKKKKVSTTTDVQGTPFNGGPNKIRLDIDEKLGGGLKAEARYQVAFNTAFNSGLTDGQEAWVGLRGDVGRIRFGKVTGAYKASAGLIDPFYTTGLQARGTGGGMSGGSYRCDPLDAALAAGSGGNIPACSIGASGRGKGVTASTIGGPEGLTHSGYVSNVIELGFDYQGFSGTFQGIVDNADTLKNGGLAELKYSMPNMFTIFAAAAYTDFRIGGGTSRNKGLTNWKVGGQYQLSTLKVGLQYENAQMGTMDDSRQSYFSGSKKGGQYVIGSVDYAMGNITLAGWVAGYFSEFKPGDYSDPSINRLSKEDAVSFAVGGKYNFTKRSTAYLGYRMTNSKNNYRDENVLSLGLRHDF